MKAKKEEKPSLTGFRLYKKHREIIKTLAKRKQISQAQVVRNAIEAYAGSDIS